MTERPRYWVQVQMSGGTARPHWVNEGWSRTPTGAGRIATRLVACNHPRVRVNYRGGTVVEWRNGKRK